MQRTCCCNVKLPSYRFYGEGNKSKLNTYHNTDIEAIFPFHFVFIGSLIVSASEDPVRGSSYFTLVCLWCGRTEVQSCDYKSLHKFLGRIDNQIFLPMVLRCALELR